jgi:acyl-CoA synthetase (AMP-forming)/AMP-acid ligase II
MHGTERNIVDFLDKFAIATPGKTVFIFLKNGEDEEKRVSFSELRMMAVNLSQYLAEKKLPGERVLLVYQDVLHFIVAFLACQYCGVVAIPASYGRGSRQVERLKHLLTDADASTVLCTADSINYLQRNLAENSGVPALEIIASDNYVNGSGQLPSVSHDLNRLAFIQYSSGSTGKPKGVRITAGNLLHNQRLIAFALDALPIQ